jgi:hypothetical protein
MLGISTGRPKGFIGLVSHETVDIASIDGVAWREHETAPITTRGQRINNARIRISGVHGPSGLTPSSAASAHSSERDELNLVKT